MVDYLEEVGGEIVETVFYVERDKSDKLREILLKDDVVSRANVIFKEAKFMDKNGFYVRVVGDREQCKRAVELAKELAEEVSGEERERVLEILRKEDENMLSGFSGIFR